MIQSQTTRFLAVCIERALALLLIIGVLLYANLSRMPSGISAFLLARITVAHVLYAGLFLTAWAFCFSGVYDCSEGRFRTLKLVGNIVKASSTVTVVVAAILFVARVHTPLHKVLPCFWLLSTLLVFLRVLLAKLLETLRSNERTRVLILGTGPMARRAWRELRTNHHGAVEVHGFVDTGHFTSVLPEISSRYVGNVDDLESLLLRDVIDTIVIALPAKSCYAVIQKAITVAESVGVDLIQFDHVFQLKQNSGRATPTRLDSLDHANQLAPQLIKRVLDVVLASVFLVLLLPVMLVIAVAIKLTSPGPVLFIQERYGYRRRKFRLLKFRTMVANAEQLIKDLEGQNEKTGPIFKMKNDPRVTPLGRILRKTSVDELPQLWNVLIGNMSLVGPRPMTLRDVSLFSSSYLMRRFRVKPGITGLWQVNGRSNTSFDHWMAMDFHYIDKWSLLLDLQILLRTIPAVLRGSGAM